MLALYEMQLGVFEALRRLGFSPDDIYVGYNSGVPVTILRTQGKICAVNYPHADVIPDSEAAYVSGWLEAAAEWNGQMSNEQRMRIFTDQFLSRGGSIRLLEMLMHKGIAWRTGAEATLN